MTKPTLHVVLDEDFTVERMTDNAIAELDKSISWTLIVMIAACVFGVVFILA